MDLLSSIRKQGSRGGVNFSWDDVQTSQHRENYLGHSLMAPVGRWQKGKDLSWYAKGDDTKGKNGETAEEKKARERREEIKRIKEAEEDALARALGLPVADRNVTGSNAISVGEVKRAVKEAGVGEDDEVEDIGKGKGFGGFKMEDWSKRAEGKKARRVETGKEEREMREVAAAREDTEGIAIDQEVVKDGGIGREARIDTGLVGLTRTGGRDSLETEA
ncbi:kinase phosphorylation protein-domain-containing protein [Rhexocercosporidium sp. MPI-PUGE-AT-0058]|nr:kinase phosphorylation protein-domain-containing protein [Rhexocercosporidium sp. MPI-PUGE-AT-0058]